MSQFLNLFYSGNGWDALSIATLVFRILMLLACLGFAISLTAYVVKYRIVESIFSKVTKNVRGYDRIRREQMRKELEESKKNYVKSGKKSFMTKLYALVAQTGIAEKIPGFSEMALVIVAATIAIILFAITALKKGLLVAAVFTVVFLIITWYCLTLIAYNRKIKLECQLLQLVNSCASASMQYANLIDIFGAIYDEFTSPLKESLEACYVEAKQTNNKAAALEHLKSRFDSIQFSFIVDNLELCSSATGDYNTVARDIAETVSIYSASHEKKSSSLRNAKVNLVFLFAAGIAILWMLSIFLGGIKHVLFNTTIGNISLAALALLFFYGLNIKAEK